MNTYLTTGAILAAACTSMATAGAVVDLAPGAYTDGLSGITNSEMPELIGTVQFAYYQQFSVDPVEAVGSSSYSASLMMSGVRSNETGNLTLNFRIYNPDASLDGQISHIELSGFAGQVTRVEYRNEASGPGVAGPSSAERSIDGDLLTYDFGTSLGTGDSSRFFFAMLDVAEIDFSSTQVQATVVLTSGDAVTFDVTPPVVPTPGSIALLGLGGLCVTRRRR